ncbi:cytochrome P450 [Planoprotostelium fungivorum]|uniref:Cytochrome P450 n=1 Tax=Planoprotostelium fungivorum TaxID=1890364 RepID=A0A2P6NHV1_9EUKA|nr:cytochrome P450 [Planoprotostelium fungivorum]
MNVFRITLSLLLVIASLSVLSEAARLKGINYGIYLPSGKCSQYSDVLQDIKLISTFSDVVKIYNLIECDGAHNVMRAAATTGIKVMLGLQAGPPDRFEAEKEELVEIVQNYGWGHIFAITVGSEDIYRYGVNKTTGLNSTVIVQAVKEVKKIRTDLGGNKIPVTHVDILTPPELLAVVDVVMINVFPFWVGDSIEAATNRFAADIDWVQRQAPNKEIWLGEIGWPSGGYNLEDAVPSVANAKTYFEKSVCWCNQNDVQYFYFEAFDEPNKAHDAAGEVETTFGIISGDHKTFKYGNPLALSCDGASTIKSHYTGSTASSTYQPPGTIASNDCHTMFQSLDCKTSSEDPAQFNMTILNSIRRNLCSLDSQACQVITNGAYSYCNAAQKTSYLMNSYYSVHWNTPGACQFEGYGVAKPSTFTTSSTSSTPQDTIDRGQTGSAATLTIGLAVVALFFLFQNTLVPNINTACHNEQENFLPGQYTTMLWTIVGVVSLVGLFLQVSRIYNRYKSLSRTIPIFLEPIVPYSLLYQLNLLPRGYTKFGDPDFVWRNKFEPYRETGSLVFGIQTPTHSGAIAEVTARRDDFPKPLEQYAIVDIYGRSVVTTEGDDWKLHRKIVSPPFSEKNNRLVWIETIKQADMMMDDWDCQAKGKDGTEVQVLADTMKLALHIITAAAFGIPFKWTDSSAPWPNHQLSFYQSLVTLLDRLFSILLIPNFIFQLPIDSIRKSKNAYDEFGQYLTDIITREKEKSSEERDEGKENLMAALVRMAEGNLTDREITGNAFLFLIAGHETTAHTLMYTFYLLSMHPQVQEKMKEEADRVYGDREPRYEDFNSLVYTNAVAYEVLRLFPPVVEIPKYCPREQTLCGGKYTVPANTYVTLNVAGAHYNTNVWGPDAAEFNPSRFDPRENGEKKVRGSFIPFSEGARSCLGKKFANVEMVAALSSVLRKYTIHLPDGYDEARMKRELSESHSVLTLQPKKPISVIVKKRNSTK